MLKFERYPSGAIKSFSWNLPLPAGPTFETTAAVYMVILLIAEAVIR